MLIARLLLALALVITLAPAAVALEQRILICPPAKDLKQVQGWWSAPGGWEQRKDYKAPTPSASIDMFTGASYEGDLKGPGRMLCFYAVEGQPGVEYTMLVHPSKGGPMDYDWDCPPMKKNLTCTCNGFKRTDCEVRN
ncbi:MAG: hypothetical protein K9K66_01690 [Desulfarculaceae bacterium]|nr:hypothetical protein [Desulfarculaceae bacterium]MCF8073505.1 hypothetical protein [Desulfarculaceae bacterium]MCF8100348.1 hypothetical protein [Desulfarculaceae bacterium]MCF8117537.1 hypothetical protein [Desulfarculaceae bacterium]